MDIDNLDLYYEDCVIGGPGSFVVTIKDRENQGSDPHQVLLEVAGTNAGTRVVPVAAEREPRGELHDRRKNLAGSLGAVKQVRATPRGSGHSCAPAADDVPSR